ncbi:MAG TPA: hypothetical protein VGM37_09845 [Armatimonadota bacterium]|jgi:hypothetical protein
MLRRALVPALLLALCAAASAAPVTVQYADASNVAFQNYRRWLQEDGIVWQVLTGDSVSEGYNTPKSKTLSWFCVVNDYLRTYFGDAGRVVTSTERENSGGATCYAAGSVMPWASGQPTLATAVVTDGAVTALNIGYRGSGYHYAPDVTITCGGGTGATATASIDADGRLTGLTLCSGGSGYTSLPLVSVGNGGNCFPPRPLNPNTPFYCPDDATWVSGEGIDGINLFHWPKGGTGIAPGGLGGISVALFANEPLSANLPPCDSVSAILSQQPKCCQFTFVLDGETTTVTPVDTTLPAGSFRYGTVYPLNGPADAPSARRRVTIQADATGGAWGRLEGFLCSKTTDRGIIEINAAYRGFKARSLAMLPPDKMLAWLGIGDSKALIGPKDRVAVWLGFGTVDSQVFPQEQFIADMELIADRLGSVTCDGGKPIPVFLFVPPSCSAVSTAYIKAGFAAARERNPNVVIIDASAAFGSQANALARGWFGPSLVNGGLDLCHPRAPGHAKIGYEIVRALDFPSIMAGARYADARTVMSVAAGLSPAPVEGLNRLDVAGGDSAGRIDIADAVRLLKEASGDGAYAVGRSPSSTTTGR